MCGINGFSWCDKERILEMNYITRFRGPDDRGIFTDERVSLGHTRLSIIDLSSCGHQPMANDDKTLWITYNGEVYNHAELREDLTARGYSFSSATDTEVILYAFQEYGLECLNRFNGMWAFCIYDTEKHQLTLCRDAFGIKPLYYYLDDQRFIFSSMISAIYCHDIISAPNDRAIMEYLAYNLEDHTEDTFFNNIKRLLPGYYLKYDLDTNEVQKNPWFSLNRTLPPPDAETLRLLFTSSVRARTLADVPVGSCLSGGIDSSAIVCTLNKILPYTFPTFSFIMPGHLLDESRYIREIGKCTQTRQFCTTINPDDFIREMDDFLKTQEEPVMGLSQYAQYRVMKLAHENAVKVLLDGQGGDEIFAGYVYYFAYYFWELFFKLKWGTLLNEAVSYRKQFRNWLPFKIFIFHMLPSVLQHLLWRRFNNRWINDAYLLQCCKRKPDPRWKRMNLHEAIRLTLFTSSIPHLLRWEDKNAMRWSIESRPPFLDVRLVEAALSVPSEQLLKAGSTKVIFKAAIEDMLPNLIRERKDKIGFAAPVDELFRDGRVIQFTNEIITSKSFRSRPYWRWSVIETMVRKHQECGVNIGDTIWKWINLELWLRHYFPDICDTMENIDPG
jgi:asparagine synthase (glutamine-hydrolysing)